MLADMRSSADCLTCGCGESAYVELDAETQEAELELGMELLRKVLLGGLGAGAHHVLLVLRQSALQSPEKLA